MLAIVVHENMKLGDNTLNNEKLTLVNTKFGQNLTNCSPYFTALQYIKNLETERSYKRRVNLKNLKIKKKSIERFKKNLLVCQCRPKYSKTANKSA